jgi:hypothetical protein
MMLLPHGDLPRQPSGRGSKAQQRLLGIAVMSLVTLSIDADQAEIYRSFSDFRFPEQRRPRDASW